MEVNTKRFELAKSIVNDCEEKYGDEASLCVNYDAAKKIVVESEKHLYLLGVINRFESCIRSFALSVYYSWIEDGYKDYDRGELMACKFIQNEAQKINEFIVYNDAKKIFNHFLGL